MVQVINLKEFTLDSINYFGWELEIEFEIALTGECELNFDSIFAAFSCKEKKIFKSYSHFD